jgi:hypothetical protein
MTLIGPLVLSVLATASSAQGAAALCSAASGPRRTPLIELYTSQGCSSCPPADRWLSSLKPRVEAGEVVPIALHVGYWDYIGWKDPFAKREFNERQRMLAAGGTVYTPGVFLQGREWRQWGGLAAVENAGQAKALASIQLAVTAREPGVIKVHATSSGKADALYIALTQDGLQTDVKAGENRGARLGNDFVARAWSGPLRAPGEVTVALPAPPEAPPGSLALVAFVQDGSGVQQAVRLPLAACR